VTNVALTFAERYGTTSAMRPSQNLRDASTLMTERLRRLTLATLPADPLPTAPVSGGVTTKAVAITLTQLTSRSRASALMTTLRQATTATGSERPAVQQQLSLVLVYESDAWRVDSAAWLSPS
jgi:hypothetical protein